MERELRKSDQALEHKGLVTISIEVAEQLQNALKFLLAITKEQGRVRVSKDTLESLREGDSVKRSVLPDGAVMLTFNAASAEEGTDP